MSIIGLGTYNARGQRLPGVRQCVLILLMTFLSMDSAIAASALARCGFGASTRTFGGDALQQARCLLSPVRQYGRLGAPLVELPATLGRLIGRPVSVTVEQARSYFERIGLRAQDVGGSLDAAICGTVEGYRANYFVIHDTSSPYYGDAPFPENVDEDPRVNNLRAYQSLSDAKAHAFVNRRGESYLGHDFSVPWRATKFELQAVGKRSRGRFLHIELVQPRRRDPNGGHKNDAIAPIPGFSAIQYQRLAELYLAASIRAGIWLIPAYHAVLDGGFRDGHDDPQHFDLSAWDTSLATVLSELDR